MADESICVYVGTYTRPGRSEGVYVYRLEPRPARFERLQTIGGMEDPSYLALGAEGRYLYAVNEMADDGAVSAFAVDASTGRLQLLNRVSSKGAHPAHLSVDPTGRWVLVANYTGGTIATLPVQANGSLAQAVHVVRHTGSGPHPERQESPHPHMIVATPDGGFVLVPDLGLDRVLAYRLEAGSGHLEARPEADATLAPGAGPRHVAFGRGGANVYCLNELDLTIAVFDYDRDRGLGRPKQTLSTLPEGTQASDKYSAAAIVVHPSGRFVYTSNRGHDSIATFAVDQSNGRLTPLGPTPCGGHTPRDINIDPSGALLLVANQGSDNVAVFRIDAQSGALEPGGSPLDVPSPSRVAFTSLRRAA